MYVFSYLTFSFLSLVTPQIKWEFIVMLIFSPSMSSFSQMVWLCKTYRQNAAVIWYQHIAHLFSEGFAPAENLLLAHFLLYKCVLKKNSG